MRILFFLISLIVLFLTIYVTWYAFKNGNEQRQLYPIIERKDIINGTLIQKERPIISFNKGAVLMKTTDGKMFTFPWAYNKLYKKEAIEDFLQIGDSIIKEEGSDNIYIYRDLEEYHFILLKKINE